MVSHQPTKMQEIILLPRSKLQYVVMASVGAGPAFIGCPDIVSGRSMAAHAQRRVDLGKNRLSLARIAFRKLNHAKFYLLAFRIHRSELQLLVAGMRFIAVESHHGPRVISEHDDARRLGTRELKAL